MSLLVDSPFARDLARLIVSWLAAIVFVQAMASAVGVVQGPRHTHVPAAAGQVPAVFVHATGQSHAAEHHDHAHWERHVHPPLDGGATLQDDAQDLGASAGLVLASMVGLAPPRGDTPAAAGGHVMRASLAWSCITHAAPFPERPPRT